VKFREHVLRVQKEENLSRIETAKRFKIGEASVARWAKRIEAIKVQRSARKIHMEDLREDVRKHPFAYQWERGRRFGVSQRAIHRALRKLKVTYKKSPSSIRRQTLLPEALFRKK
jgi:transposase